MLRERKKMTYHADYADCDDDKVYALLGGADGFFGGREVGPADLARIAGQCDAFPLRAWGRCVWRRAVCCLCIAGCRERRAGEVCFAT